MGCTLEFATEAERDYELVFDHLTESYQIVGEPPAAAARRADCVLAFLDRSA